MARKRRCGQGIIREHSGHLDGTFRERSGHVQGSVRERSGHVQGTLHSGHFSIVYEGEKLSRSRASVTKRRCESF
jgi:hypothetical protein